MTMMYWKLNESVEPAQASTMPAFFHTRPVRDTAHIAEAAPVTQTFPPLQIEPQLRYEETALAGMRYLADALGIPHWAFLRHYHGMLATTVGIGDYRRYVPTGALPVGRLAELPTINLLGVRATSRSVAGEAAAIAPYGAPIVRADGSLFGVLCTFADRISAEQVEPNPQVVELVCATLRRAVMTDLALREVERLPDVTARSPHSKRTSWEKFLTAALVASIAPAALALVGLALGARHAARQNARANSLLGGLSAGDRRLLRTFLQAGF